MTTPIKLDNPPIRSHSPAGDAIDAQAVAAIEALRLSIQGLRIQGGRASAPPNLQPDRVSPLPGTLLRMQALQIVIKVLSPSFESEDEPELVRLAERDKPLQDASAAGAASAPAALEHAPVAAAAPSHQKKIRQADPLPVRNARRERRLHHRRQLPRPVGERSLLDGIDEIPGAEVGPIFQALADDAGPPAQKRARAWGR